MRQPRFGYCQCIHIKQRGWTRSATGKFVCSSCGKPTDAGMQLFQYDCYDCEEPFVKNFSHPAYNHDYPRCWWCLESYHSDEVAYNYIVPFVKVPPPVAESFEGIFDFE